MQHLDQLNNQQRAFVLEYIKHFVVARAARAVGATESAGYNWMSDPLVQAAVAEAMEDRLERTKIDADWLLQQLGQMFAADLADIYNLDGTLRPIHEWPEAWRKMAKSIKVNEIWENIDGTRVPIGQVKEATFIDRLKVLEMIGKHTDVRAFVERVSVSTDQELTDRLLAGRRRAREAALRKEGKSFL